MSKPWRERRWPWFAAAVAIVFAALSTMVEIRAPGEWDERPVGSADDIEALRDRDDVNVLFLLIDTLRAEHLGSYGYERDTSPVMDRLASSGVRFARHLSQSSWTKSSMASLWTGLHPVRTGITRYDQVIPDAARMSAEAFQEAGFQTIGLYRNGWVAPTFGFDQGFDVYRRPVKAPMAAGVRRANPALSDSGSDEAVVADALEFLRLRGSERWFLYLHLMDLHEYTYDEESALFGSRYVDIYDNSIRWTDGVLDVLFDNLAAMGHLDRTLVVIASDHGEAFGERGFEGHARKVYRETTEVPLFLLFPFRLEPGAVVPSRTANIDVWPTVLDLVGLSLGETDGRSRVPEILAAVRGESTPADDERAISFLDQSWARGDRESEVTVAVTEGPLRYVRVDQATGRVEQLFDADGDPDELRDHADEEAEAVERLSGVADAYLALEPDWGASPTRSIGELELNHLRALGYAVP